MSHSAGDGENFPRSVSECDEIRNERSADELKSPTQIAQRVAKVKGQGTYHSLKIRCFNTVISRRTNGRWRSKVLEWTPTKKCSVGKLSIRLTDDVKVTAGAVDIHRLKRTTDKIE